jgi:hypothetical protein
MHYKYQKLREQSMNYINVKSTNPKSNNFGLDRIKIFTALCIFITFSMEVLADKPFSQYEARDVEAFSAVEVGGLVNVVLKHGNELGVEVSAYGIELDEIISEVNEGVLLLTTSGFHSGESIKVIVTYEYLNEVRTSGAATIKTSGVIQSEHFKIKISDSGDANIEVAADKLEVEMRGNGNLKIYGTANTQTIASYGGGGRLDNSDLKIIGQ